MMKIKKSFLSVCLSILFMFGCFVPSISVYAVGDVWSSGQSYTYFQNNFDDINTRLNGVIINQNGLREDFEDFVDEYRDNYNIPSGTSSSTWIGDNISGTYQNGSSGVSDLGFSQIFRQAMRDWCNAYLEANTGYKYGYTWTSSQFVSYFDSQDKYNGFLDILNNNQNKYVVFSGVYIYVAETELIPVIHSYVSSYNSFNVGLYKSDWSFGTGPYDRYSWSSSGNVWSLQHFNEGSFVGADSNMSAGIPASSALINFSVPVALNTKTYLCYKSEDAMKNTSVGVQDYYVTDSYNSTISGSYNTTTTDIQNTIDSNNVNNYINNYYVENGQYPTPTQINIYINNYDGSGNGGGSGDNDDDNNGDNNIWDFLNGIGDFLGNLISSLGEVLTGILSLLTDVIDLFIGEDGLPNIFSQLVSYYLGFLPQEFLRLIELFVVCVLIVGIIKLIRGS